MHQRFFSSTAVSKVGTKSYICSKTAPAEKWIISADNIYLPEKNFPIHTNEIWQSLCHEKKAVAQQVGRGLRRSLWCWTKSLDQHTPRIRNGSLGETCRQCHVDIVASMLSSFLQVLTTVTPTWKLLNQCNLIWDILGELKFPESRWAVAVPPSWWNRYE